MSFEAGRGNYVIAETEAGLLIIHSSPITLSWVPRDIVNKEFNVGGTVTVGTFESLNEAKHAAGEQYPVPAEAWHVSDVLPFDSDAKTRTEIHIPEIDGHKLLRHGIRWK